MQALNQYNLILIYKFTKDNKIKYGKERFKLKEITEIQKDLMHSTVISQDHIKLYFYKKRTKKGETYFECAYTNIKDLASPYSEVITSICNFIDEKEVYTYAYDMPKNAIAFFELENSSNLLYDGLSKLNNAIVSASNFDDAIRYDGYIIECLKDSNFIRLIISAKAIRTYTRRFFIFNNEFTHLDNPMFEIKNIADCIWLNNYCLFLTSNAESIFDLERHYKLLAQKHLEYLEHANLLSAKDMSFFKAFSMQRKRPQKFESFRSTRIDDLKELSIQEQKKVLNGLGINISDGNKISISSEEDANRFLDFICCKILDDFNGDKYFVTNSQKFNHSDTPN